MYTEYTEGSDNGRNSFNHLITTAAPWGGYYFDFTHEKTEVQGHLDSK